MKTEMHSFSKYYSGILESQERGDVRQRSGQRCIKGNVTAQREEESMQMGNNIVVDFRD